MEEKSRHPYRRRKRRRSILYGPVSFLIICIAVIFGMSVFFKITDIEVAGSGTYSADEVIEASGIKVGDNLFTIKKSDAVNGIFASLPYVEETTISKVFPNKIIITVTEGLGIGCVDSDSGSWLINSRCKILRKAETSDIDSTIKITGISIVEPEAGKLLAVIDEDSLNLEYLKDAMDAFNTRDMLNNITEIDLSAVSNLKFRYMDRYDVRLGKNNSLGYKLDLLQSAIDKVGDNEVGTFDLTKDKEVHFIPE